MSVLMTTESSRIEMYGTRFKAHATRELGTNSRDASRAYLSPMLKKLGQRLNLMCGTRAAIHGDFYARTRRCEWPTLLSAG